MIHSLKRNLNGFFWCIHVNLQNQHQKCSHPLKTCPSFGHFSGLLLWHKSILHMWAKWYHPSWGFPGGSKVKNLPANAGDAGDMGSIPGSGRYPGRGNGNPFPVFLLDTNKWIKAIKYMPLVFFFPSVLLFLYPCFFLLKLLHTQMNYLHPNLFLRLL